MKEKYSIIAIPELRNSQDLEDRCEGVFPKVNKDLLVILGTLVYPYFLFGKEEEKYGYSSTKENLDRTMNIFNYYLNEQLQKKRLKNFPQFIKETKDGVLRIDRDKLSKAVETLNDIIEKTEKEVKEEYKRIADKLEKMKTPYFIVPSVFDFEPLLREYFKDKILHKEVKNLEGILISGFGGSPYIPQIPLLLEGPYLFKEDAHVNGGKIEVNYSEAIDFFNQIEQPDLVFTFWPPFGFSDEIEESLGNKKSVGSPGLCVVLENANPDLWIVGRGFERDVKYKQIGGTYIVSGAPQDVIHVLYDLDDRNAEINFYVDKKLVMHAKTSDTSLMKEIFF
ncbi:MAG: hypothetical protein NZ889_00850 [Candidatus Pacearchaeota archaeon]|nr:hypothetical protein [Candidatus Pacearchaeota archaeon]